MSSIIKKIITLSILVITGSLINISSVKACNIDSASVNLVDGTTTYDFTTLLCETGQTFDVKLEVDNPSGTEVYDSTVTVTNAGNYNWATNLGYLFTETGDYTATLTVTKTQNLCAYSGKAACDTARAIDISFCEQNVCNPLPIGSEQSFECYLQCRMDANPSGAECRNLCGETTADATDVYASVVCEVDPILIGGLTRARVGSATIKTTNCDDKVVRLEYELRSPTNLFLWNESKTDPANGTHSFSAIPEKHFNSDGVYVLYARIKINGVIVESESFNFNYTDVSSISATVSHGEDVVRLFSGSNEVVRDAQIDLPYTVDWELELDGAVIDSGTVSVSEGDGNFSIATIESAATDGGSYTFSGELKHRSRVLDSFSETIDVCHIASLSSPSLTSTRLGGTSITHEFCGEQSVELIYEFLSTSGSVLWSQTKTNPSNGAHNFNEIPHQHFTGDGDYTLRVRALIDGTEALSQSTTFNYTDNTTFDGDYISGYLSASLFTSDNEVSRSASVRLPYDLEWDLSLVGDSVDSGSQSLASGTGVYSLGTETPTISVGGSYLFTGSISHGTRTIDSFSKTITVCGNAAITNVTFGRNRVVDVDFDTESCTAGATQVQLSVTNEAGTEVYENTGSFGTSGIATFTVPENSFVNDGQYTAEATLLISGSARANLTQSITYTDSSTITPTVEHGNQQATLFANVNELARNTTIDLPYIVNWRVERLSVSELTGSETIANGNSVIDIESEIFSPSTGGEFVFSGELVHAGRNIDTFSESFSVCFVDDQSNPSLSSSRNASAEYSSTGCGNATVDLTFKLIAPDGSTRWSSTLNSVNEGVHNFGVIPDVNFDEDGVYQIQSEVSVDGEVRDTKTVDAPYVDLSRVTASHSSGYLSVELFSNSADVNRSAQYRLPYTLEWDLSLAGSSVQSDIVSIPQGTGTVEIDTITYSAGSGGIYEFIAELKHGSRVINSSTSTISICGSGVVDSVSFDSSRSVSAEFSTTECTADATTVRLSILNPDNVEVYSNVGSFGASGTADFGTMSDSIFVEDGIYTAQVEVLIDGTSRGVRSQTLTYTDTSRLDVAFTNSDDATLVYFENATDVIRNTTVSLPYEVTYRFMKDGLIRYSGEVEIANGQNSVAIDSLIYNIPEEGDWTFEAELRHESRIIDSFSDNFLGSCLSPVISIDSYGIDPGLDPQTVTVNQSSYACSGTINASLTISKAGETIVSPQIVFLNSPLTGTYNFTFDELVASSTPYDVEIRYEPVMGDDSVVSGSFTKTCTEVAGAWGDFFNASSDDPMRFNVRYRNDYICQGVNDISLEIRDSENTIVFSESRSDLANTNSAWADTSFDVEPVVFGGSYTIDAVITSESESTITLTNSFDVDCPSVWILNGFSIDTDSMMASTDVNGAYGCNQSATYQLIINKQGDIEAFNNTFTDNLQGEPFNWSEPWVNGIAENEQAGAYDAELIVTDQQGIIRTSLTSFSLDCPAPSASYQSSNVDIDLDNPFTYQFDILSEDLCNLSVAASLEIIDSNDVIVVSENEVGLTAGTATPVTYTSSQLLPDSYTLRVTAIDENGESTTVDQNLVVNCPNETGINGAFGALEISSRDEPWVIPFRYQTTYDCLGEVSAAIEIKNGGGAVVFADTVENLVNTNGAYLWSEFTPDQLAFGQSYTIEITLSAESGSSDFISTALVPECHADWNDSSILTRDNPDRFGLTLVDGHACNGTASYDLNISRDLGGDAFSRTGVMDLSLDPSVLQFEWSNGLPENQRAGNYTAAIDVTDENGILKTFTTTFSIDCPIPTVSWTAEKLAIDSDDPFEITFEHQSEDVCHGLAEVTLRILDSDGEILITGFQDSIAAGVDSPLTYSFAPLEPGQDYIARVRIQNENNDDETTEFPFTVDCGDFSAALLATPTAITGTVSGYGCNFPSTMVVEVTDESGTVIGSANSTSITEVVNLPIIYSIESNQLGGDYTANVTVIDPYGVTHNYTLPYSFPCYEPSIGVLLSQSTEPTDDPFNLTFEHISPSVCNGLGNVELNLRDSSDDIVATSLVTNLAGGLTQPVSLDFSPVIGGTYTAELILTNEYGQEVVDSRTIVVTCREIEGAFGEFLTSAENNPMSISTTYSAQDSCSGDVTALMEILDSDNAIIHQESIGGLSSGTVDGVVNFSFEPLTFGQSYTARYTITSAISGDHFQYEQGFDVACPDWTTLNNGAVNESELIFSADLSNRYLCNGPFTAQLTVTRLLNDAVAFDESLSPIVASDDDVSITESFSINLPANEQGGEFISHLTVTDSLQNSHSIEVPFSQPCPLPTANYVGASVDYNVDDPFSILAQVGSADTCSISLSSELKIISNGVEVVSTTVTNITAGETSDVVFEFDKLEPGITYDGQIITSDSLGNTTTETFNFTVDCIDFSFDYSVNSDVIDVTTTGFNCNLPLNGRVTVNDENGVTIANDVVIFDSLNDADNYRFNINSRYLGGLYQYSLTLDDPNGFSQTMETSYLYPCVAPVVTGLTGKTLGPLDDPQAVQVEYASTRLCNGDGTINYTITDLDSNVLASGSRYPLVSSTTSYPELDFPNMDGGEYLLNMDISDEYGHFEQQQIPFTIECPEPIILGMGSSDPYGNKVDGAVELYSCNYPATANVTIQASDGSVVYDEVLSIVRQDEGTPYDVGIIPRIITGGFASGNYRIEVTVDGATNSSSYTNDYQIKVDDEGPQAELRINNKPYVQEEDYVIPSLERITFKHSDPSGSLKGPQTIAENYLDASVSSELTGRLLNFKTTQSGRVGILNGYLLDNVLGNEGGKIFLLATNQSSGEVIALEAEHRYISLAPYLSTFTGRPSPTTYDAVNNGFAAMFDMSLIVPGNYRVDSIVTRRSNGQYNKVTVNRMLNVASNISEGRPTIDGANANVIGDALYIRNGLNALYYDQLLPLGDYVTSLSLYDGLGNKTEIAEFGYRYQRNTSEQEVKIPIIEGFPAVNAELDIYDYGLSSSLQNSVEVTVQRTSGSANLTFNGVMVDETPVDMTISKNETQRNYQLLIQRTSSEVDGEYLVVVKNNSANNVSLTISEMEIGAEVYNVSEEYVAGDPSVRIHARGESGKDCRHLVGGEVNETFNFSRPFCSFKWRTPLADDGLKTSRYGLVLSGVFNDPGDPELIYEVGVAYTDPVTNISRFYFVSEHSLVPHVRPPEPVSVSFVPNRRLVGYGGGEYTSVGQYNAGRLYIRGDVPGLHASVTFEGETLEYSTGSKQIVVQVRTDTDAIFDIYDVDTVARYETIALEPTSHEMDIIALPLRSRLRLNPVVDATNTSAIDITTQVDAGSSREPEVYDAALHGEWDMHTRIDNQRSDSEPVGGHFGHDASGAGSTQINIPDAGRKLLYVEGDLIVPDGLDVDMTLRSPSMYSVIRNGTPIESYLATSKTQWRTPFNNYVRVFPNDNKRNIDIGSIRWEISSNNVDWTEVPDMEERALIYQFSMPDAERRYVRATTINTYTGLTYTTESVLLHAFNLPDFHIEGDTASFIDHPATLSAVVDNGVNTEFTWEVKKGRAGEVTTYTGASQTLQYVDDDIYYITVKAKEVDSPDIPLAYRTKYTRLVVRPPNMGRPLLIVSRRMEIGQSYEIRMEPPEIYGGVNTSLPVLSTLTLPNGTTVNNQETVNYTAVQSDMVNGELSFSYRAWVSGYESQTEQLLSTESDGWIYAWPSFNVRLVSNNIEAPARMRFYVEPNALTGDYESMNNEPLTYTANLMGNGSIYSNRGNRFDIDYPTDGSFNFAVEVRDTRGNVASATNSEIVVEPSQSFSIRTYVGNYNTDWVVPTKIQVDPQIVTISGYDDVETYTYYLDGIEDVAAGSSGKGWVTVNTPGMHTFRVVAVTENGETAEHSETGVTVANQAPDCTLSITQVGTAVTDANVVCVDEDGYIAKYEWFIDGVMIDGSVHNVHIDNTISETVASIVVRCIDNKGAVVEKSWTR